MANLRTYRELLFPIRLKQEAEQAEVLADEVWQSGIGDFLKECHKQGTPFRFRVEIRADMENDKRASFAKKFAIQLERVSARWLINSTGDYETEIRLIKKKDGEFAPFLKLYTIPMRRFAYRKNAVAASIHPSLTAHTKVRAMATTVRSMFPSLSKAARLPILRSSNTLKPT